MKKNPKSLALLSLLTAVVPSVALADPIAGSPAPTLVSPSTPAPTAKGSFEILLLAPPAILGTVANFQPHGFGIGESTQTGSNLFGYIGIGGGVAYALTDLIQLGAAVSFYMNGAGTGAGDFGLYEIVAEPLVKFNFGPLFHTGAINPMVMAGISFGAQGTTGQGGTGWGVFGAEADPGVEWLFGGRWGIDAYVPIQLQFATGDLHDHVGFNLGVGYGLVGYL